MHALTRFLGFPLVGMLLLLAGCAPKPEAVEAPPSAPTGAEPVAPAAPAEAGAEGAAKVTLETSKGTIRMELYPDKAPITVKNFLEYARGGHFEGTVFHRVIPGFMIQGGGFTPDMTEKPTREGIKNEGGNGLRNDRGTVAMARTPDPDSASAQFFINVSDNAFLNRDQSPDGFGYAVFGKVTEGMDVVDAIVAVPTSEKMTPSGPMENVPVEPVLIKSVQVE